MATRRREERRERGRSRLLDDVKWTSSQRTGVLFDYADIRFDEMLTLSSIHCDVEGLCQNERDVVVRSMYQQRSMASAVDNSTRCYVWRT